jgi:predicted outer membrane repeat protein
MVGTRGLVVLLVAATASEGDGTIARIYVTSVADSSDGTALPADCRVFDEDGNDLSGFERARKDTAEEERPRAANPIKHTVRLVASGSVVGGGSSLTTTRPRDRVLKDRRRNADPATDGVKETQGDGVDTDRCDSRDGLGSCAVARANGNTPFECKCTLRAALLLANEVPLTHSVFVELPRGAVHLSGQLPTITRAIKLSGVPPIPDVRMTPDDQCIAASQSFTCPDERRGQPNAPQGATYPLCSVVDGQRLHRAIMFDPRDNPGDAAPPLLGLQHVSFRNCRAFVGSKSPGDGSGNGGAIRVKGNAHLLAYGCEFANNHAEKNGGAVQMTGEEGDAQFHLTSGHDNEAGLCGGTLDVALTRAHVHAWLLMR